MTSPVVWIGLVVLVFGILITLSSVKEYEGIGQMWFSIPMIVGGVGLMGWAAFEESKELDRTH